MRSLIRRPSHTATTHGHIGGPRLYDTLANVFFFGRRRATFQALVAAAGVQPGRRVLDVGCGTGLVMHHLPADLRLAALREVRRVLRPGGKLLVAEAQKPRHGLGWQLLARFHGYDWMARMVPHLEPLAAQAGFGEIRTGEAPPWLRYVHAVKTASAM